MYRYAYKFIKHNNVDKKEPRMAAKTQLCLLHLLQILPSNQVLLCLVKEEKSQVILESLSSCSLCLRILPSNHMVLMLLCASLKPCPMLAYLN